LADQLMMADFFHGVDGLGGIYSTHPHLTPQDTWKDLFAKTVRSTDPDEAALAREISGSHHTLFTPSRRPAHEEILRILRENEPDTITLVAIGPLTNFATAAAADTEAFLRAKEVVVMGGAIEEPGNVRFPPPLSNPKMPCPPFHLIKQPPSPLRTLLNLRNQITPSAGALLICKWIDI
jgi:inosine-uridine nucleoside N-ribohydrolase